MIGRHRRAVQRTVAFKEPLHKGAQIVGIDTPRVGIEGISNDLEGSGDLFEKEYLIITDLDALLQGETRLVSWSFSTLIRNE